jgi:hypothetical protein
VVTLLVPLRKVNIKMISLKDSVIWDRRKLRRAMRDGKPNALYHEKVMRAGLSAMGKRKCDATTVAMGKMATKSVIIQS